MYIADLKRPLLSYLQAHNMIRNITGIGKGAYIVIHDGFQADSSWKDFLPGSDVSPSSSQHPLP